MSQEIRLATASSPEAPEMSIVFRSLLPLQGIQMRKPGKADRIPFAALVVLAEARSCESTMETLEILRPQRPLYERGASPLRLLYLSFFSPLFFYLLKKRPQARSPGAFSFEYSMKLSQTTYVSGRFLLTGVMA